MINTKSHRQSDIVARCLSRFYYTARLTSCQILAGIWYKTSFYRQSRIVTRLFGIMLLLLPQQLYAESKIVAALSANEVVLDYNFKGQQITVSGILNGDYDIVISVKGPERTYRLWKKEQYYGIWIKNKSFTIPYGTSYYYIAASDAIEKIVAKDEIARYHLDYLNEKYYIMEKHLPEEMLAFKDEFLHYRQNLHLYPTNILPIKRINNNIFRTEFSIPEYAHVGKYEVMIYAFKNKVLVDTLALSFITKKRGLYAKIDDLAENKPLQYSLISIIIALSAGAIAAFLFRKDRQ